MSRGPSTDRNDTPRTPLPPRRARGVEREIDLAVKRGVFVADQEILGARRVPQKEARLADPRGDVEDEGGRVGLSGAQGRVSGDEGPCALSQARVASSEGEGGKRRPERSSRKTTRGLGVSGPLPRDEAIVFGSNQVRTVTTRLVSDGDAESAIS